MSKMDAESKFEVAVGLNNDVMTSFSIFTPHVTQNPNTNTSETSREGITV
jgi:hypothetical protein